METYIHPVLPDGEYNLTVSRQKQNKHIAGTLENQRYIEQLKTIGRLPSVLAAGVDVDELVKKFHKKGIYYPNPKDGSPREIVDTGEVVGKYWDKDEQNLIDTTWIEIVYSKKTVHVFPIRPRW